MSYGWTYFSVVYVLQDDISYDSICVKGMSYMESCIRRWHVLQVEISCKSICSMSRHVLLIHMN